MLHPAVICSSFISLPGFLSVLASAISRLPLLLLFLLLSVPARQFILLIHHFVTFISHLFITYILHSSNRLTARNKSTTLSIGAVVEVVYYSTDVTNKCFVWSRSGHISPIVMTFCSLLCNRLLPAPLLCAPLYVIFPCCHIFVGLNNILKNNKLFFT